MVAAPPGHRKVHTASLESSVLSGAYQPLNEYRLSVKALAVKPSPTSTLLASAQFPPEAVPPSPAVAATS